MYLPIQIMSDTESGMEIVEGLLDSGASGEFIDQDYARDIHAIKKDLPNPIPVYNVDGTPNKEGTITQYVDLNLKIHERQRKHRLQVTGLGNQQIILGYTWLKEMNPLIDWKKGILEWRKWKHSVLKKQPEESKTIKYYTFVKGMIIMIDSEKTEPKKPKSGKKSKSKKQPFIMITEEDKEEYLNHTDSYSKPSQQRRRQTRTSDFFNDGR
jgi:hypothetical protein